jgi:hypothetical protein
MNDGLRQSVPPNCGAPTSGSFTKTVFLRDLKNARLKTPVRGQFRFTSDPKIGGQKNASLPEIAFKKQPTF